MVSRDGTVMRELASHQCDEVGVTWVEFVIGSHLAPRVFLWLRAS